MSEPRTGAGAGADTKASNTTRANARPPAVGGGGAAGLLVSAGSGAILSLALPPHGNPLFALALVPLFTLVAVAGTRRRAFWLGAAFALPFFALYILWLPRSFSQPSILGPAFWAVYPGMLVILACMWGFVTWAARALGGRGAGTLWLLPSFWVLMEWARTQGYLGFPWGTLGYLWLDTPVAQLAAIVGTYGLSLIVTTAAALFAAPLVSLLRMRVPPARVGLRRQRPARRSPWALGAPLLAVAGLALVYGLGQARLPAAGAGPVADHSAVVVQGNVDPFGRALGASQELDVHTSLTSMGVAGGATAPDLVVWPEGAVLGYSVENLRGQAIRDVVQAAAPASTFIFGGRAYDGDHSFNSAYSMTDRQLVDRYDKAYLVPFGERWPLLEVAAPLYRAVFGLFNLPLLANTTPGHGPVPLDTPEGLAATYICYESVFPQVTRRMVADGGQLLVNITNDAWFSRGNGAQQHFDMGRMRAIETHRYLLRSGNDGITAVVDPYGRVQAQLPQHVASFLRADYALLDDLTPFVRFGSLWIPLLALLTLGTLSILALQRRG